MRLVSCFTAAGLIASAVSVPAASAADLLGNLRRTLPPVSEEGASVTWYLRGDISKSYYKEPQSDYVVTAVNPNIGPIDYRREHIRPSLGASIGAGLRYRFLRFDLTYEARKKTPYLGYVPPFNDWNHAGPFPVPSRRDRYSLGTSTIMANGYMDLGGWFGMNPYVGAGIGATHYSASNYISEPLPLTAQLGGVTQTSLIGSGKGWNLTWALMAGMTVGITHNLKLDAGYRYINMGAVKFNHVDQATGQVVARIKSKDIAAHEVRLGLRYEFAAPPRSAANTFSPTTFDPARPPM